MTREQAIKNLQTYPDDQIPAIEPTQADVEAAIKQKAAEAEKWRSKMTQIRQSGEFQHQSAFFRRIRLHIDARPQLRWIHASLNGAKLSPAQAGKAKAAGMVAGIFDLFIPFPNCRDFDNGRTYAGAYLEFKYGKNKLTPEQKEFEAFVRETGFYTLTVYDVDDAVRFVERWIGQKFELEYFFD